MCDRERICAKKPSCFTIALPEPLFQHRGFMTGSLGRVREVSETPSEKLLLLGRYYNRRQSGAALRTGVFLDMVS